MGSNASHTTHHSVSFGHLVSYVTLHQAVYAFVGQYEVFA